MGQNKKQYEDSIPGLNAITHWGGQHSEYSSGHQGEHSDISFGVCSTTIVKDWDYFILLIWIDMGPTLKNMLRSIDSLQELQGGSYTKCGEDST